VALGDGAPALGLGGRTDATADDAVADGVAGAGLAGDPHAVIIETTTIATVICLIEVFIVVSFGRYDPETLDLSVCNDMDVSACRHPVDGYEPASLQIVTPSAS
jgi:predicted secreted protein